MSERPYGTTGTDGKFLLTTLDKDDGAPAGQYKVLVQWVGNISPPSGGDPDRGGGQPDRLRGRYMNLEKSTLMATIDEGPTEIPAFELTSK